MSIRLRFNQTSGAKDRDDHEGTVKEDDARLRRVMCRLYREELSEPVHMSWRGDLVVYKCLPLHSAVRNKSPLRSRRDPRQKPTRPLSVKRTGAPANIPSTVPVVAVVCTRSTATPWTTEGITSGSTPTDSAYFNCCSFTSQKRPRMSATTSPDFSGGSFAVDKRKCPDSCWK